MSNFLRKKGTMLKPIGIVTGFAFLSLILPFPLMAADNPLEAYRWQNRLLLMFVPHSSDPRLTEIQRTVTNTRCALNERDLLLGVFVEDGKSSLNDLPLSAYEVAALRARYGIKRGQFSAILIGKDGSKKSQTGNVPEWENIFALIDNMPMRQSEMKKNPQNCSS